MSKVSKRNGAAGEDEAFPRGGKQLLSAAEKKRLRAEGKAEAERDFLSAGPRKKRKSTTAEEDGEDLAFAREASQGRLPKFVELLKFRNLGVGAKIWGCILAVSHKELSVSLPDGLRGTVPLEEASDVLSELLKKAERRIESKARQSTAGDLPSLQALFHPGQFVRATIIQLEEESQGTKGGAKKRALLSLKVARQNSSLAAANLVEGLSLPACVRSVEDHGYTLTFGIKGVTGFLDKEESPAAAAQLPGAIQEVVVSSAADKRMVRVKASPQQGQEPAKEWPGLTIGSLLPGMLVNAKIQHVLSDGLLVSFLTYFTATIDPFHISKDVAVADGWKKGFSIGQRVRARVLYVDPGSKRVCLSLLQHLIKTEPPSLPPVGTLIKDAVVQRVDPRLGVLLDLAAHGSGFAHISDISDERVDRLEKVLKPGQKEAARVIGSRPMDGLAVLSLKPTAVEQYLADGVNVGDAVKGEVVLVDDKGLLVNIARNLNAFVPNEHTSDLGAEQGKAKHKVGRQVSGRILKVDPVKRRMTMTLKKALIGSKLKPLASWEDVLVGVWAHGTVNGIADFGVFVHFYGDMRGLLHVSELGLEPGIKASDAYSIGQVVKVRIVSADPAAKRIQLTLSSKKSKSGAVHGGAALTAGTAAEGVVTDVVSAGDEDVPTAFKVDLRKNGKIIGSGHLEVGHLSDHSAAVTALRDCIQVGSEIGTVLVLEQVRGSQTLRLTRKASLVNSRETLPQSLDDLAEAQLHSGYVANVTHDAVYVRFLNGLTGRAGLAHLADAFVSDPEAVFSRDQSVRVQVLQVNQEKGQFSLSLKRSTTGDASAILTETLFRDLELAAQLKAAAEEAEGEPPVEWSNFEIGAVAKGCVHELKDYGTLVDLDKDPNIVGLIASHQAEGELEVGSKLRIRILDVNKKDGILDLSCKRSLLKGVRSRKAQAKESSEPFKVGDVVEGEVELHRDDYAVIFVSKPQSGIGFVGFEDFNTKDGKMQNRLPLHAKQSFTVAALPKEEAGGRLILQAADPKAGQKERKPNPPKLKAGSLVEGKIARLSKEELIIELGKGPNGRVHVTEMTDDAPPASSPLSAVKVGQQIKAVVLGPRRFGKRVMDGFELSLRPSAVQAAERGETGFDRRLTFSKVQAQSVHTGFVTKLTSDSLHVTLGARLSGRVSLLGLSTSLSELAALSKGLASKFNLGQPVQCRVVKVDRAQERLDLSLVLKPPEGPVSTPEGTSIGSLLMGRITDVRGDGVRVHLGWHDFGTASLLDLHDTWVENALDGLRTGMFVRCCVIGTATEAKQREQSSKKVPGGDKEEPEGDKEPEVQSRGRKRKRQKSQSSAPKALLQLSLQASKGGEVPCWASKPRDGDAAEPWDQKQPPTGAEVQGYIKFVSKMGAFVAIGKGLDARVRLSKLSDGFVKEPESEFPAGKLVKGVVIASSPEKVEISLKTKQADLLKNLVDGQTVRGVVTKVEDFGVFVKLRESPLVGLVHVSQVADKFVKDLKAVFSEGQGVRAKVLTVDHEKRLLHLGTKPSYFVGEEEDEEDEAVEAAMAATPGLDLETAEVDSDSGSDWRNAACDRLPDEEEEEEGGESEEAEEPLLITKIRAAPRKRLKLEKAVQKAAEEQEEGDSEDESGAESPREAAGARQEANGSAPIFSGVVGWEDEDTAPKAGTTIAGAPGPPAKLAAKRELKRRKREEAVAAQAAEVARLEGSGPQSAPEFESELAESPDSSFLWIKYMAFLVSLGEPAKARVLAERALEKINYRKEEEKFNVWVARLNLEMQYGDPPEEAAAKLFQRALAFNNQKRLYLAFVGILERFGQEELLAQTFKAATRKFPESAKVWLRQMAHAQSRGDAEGATKILERAISSMPNRKHIKMLRQSALQEFKLGSPERGRSIFEGLLRNYPKRLDLWSVYIDQEIKQGEQARIRSLFERATALVLPAKKIKFLFKRNLDYELQSGTPATVSKVKQAAKEYIAQHLEG